MNLKAFITEQADFPIPGVLFRDISPLLQNPAALHYVLEDMVKTIDLGGIDFIAGIESRGFILGSALAAKFNKGFLPVRKAGKLPPPFEAITYKLEYGEASLEMKRGCGRLLVIDDVLATGGTLQAACELSERAGYQVMETAVLIDLVFLNQLRIKGKKVHSVIQYEN